MDISRQTLDAIYTGFKKNFADGFAAVTPTWQRVATLVPSNTSQETYPWLGTMPGMREWIGDRQIKKFGLHDYTIKNRSFEQTVGVNRTKIEDDQIGIYKPMFEGLGRAAAAHPDQLVWQSVKDGFASLCYDGQNFFDTDHPVGGENGVPASTVSNMQAGSSPMWFLLDLSKPLLPFIFQQRKKADKLIRLDKEDDQNVFMRGEFVYGSDGRGNAGYGFWQLAYGSKAELTPDNFKAARLAMETLIGDDGEPLGVTATALVHGPSNRDKAEAILKKENLANGETNTLRNAVEPIAVSRLG